MIKIENKLFFLLAFLMAFVVALSNYLVQFPIKYFSLENLLTYGAFSYPVAFLITDLSNRRYGKNIAKKIGTNKDPSEGTCTPTLLHVQNREFTANLGNAFCT